MEKILFVLPLAQRFICPVHKGVLREPVLSPGGQNVCKECIKQDPATANVEAELNKDLQDDINSLLCYCKYGVMINSNGVLTADPKGCDHIIRFGNRGQHEATCEFRDADFVMVDNSQGAKEVEVLPSPVITGPVLLPCNNKDDGCFFLAVSSEELDVHLNECSYERLRRLLRQSKSRVQLLEKEIQLRDAEIAELHQRLEEEKNTAAEFAKKALGNGREMFDEFVRVLEEELPQGIIAMREQLLQSPAFMKSSSALSSFKSTFVRKTEKIKQDISELHPLENFAELHPIDKLAELKDKLPSISFRPALNSSMEAIAEMHPLDKLIAILSNLKNDIMAYAAEYNTPPAITYDVNDYNSNNKGKNYVDDEIKESPKVTPLSYSSGLEDDEEFKKQVVASLETYEEERKKRIEIQAREAAAVATAAVRSLQTN